MANPTFGEIFLPMPQKAQCYMLSCLLGLCAVLLSGESAAAQSGETTISCSAKADTPSATVWARVSKGKQANIYEQAVTVGSYLHDSAVTGFRYERTSHGYFTVSRRLGSNPVIELNMPSPVSPVDDAGIYGRPGAPLRGKVGAGYFEKTGKKAIMEVTTVGDLLERNVIRFESITDFKFKFRLTKAQLKKISSSLNIEVKLFTADGELTSTAEFRTTRLREGMQVADEFAPNHFERVRQAGQCKGFYGTVALH
jgi:hypothetical protein